MRAARHTSSVCLFCQHATTTPRSIPQLQGGPVRSFTTLQTRHAGDTTRHEHGHKFGNVVRRQPSQSKIKSINGPSTSRRNPFAKETRKGATNRTLSFRGGRAAVSIEQALPQALRVIEQELKEAPIVSYLDKEGHTFKSTFEAFKNSVWRSKRAWDPEESKFFNSLEDEFNNNKQTGLEARLKYGFYGYVSGLRFTESDIQNQKAVADLRYPVEWYPATRRLQRKVHLHVGPTNSGKTYHALKSLEAAHSGMYAGPLRLLAHEVYVRMNAKGKRTLLLTGEERRAPDNTSTDFAISSCTVEMLDLNRVVDVAVIDEIQMLGSQERGWAWTQALLGVQAKELHLCGEARTVPIIQELCAMIGEKPIIHTYDRLSPLEMDKQSLDGDLSKLRKGDCIVSFSVMGIHALRKVIEEQTGKKVAIVYGGLPPETRAQQARLFNDPDNDYDYLVASDAIGMGLNLSIKRVIFETTTKFNGQDRQTIPLADMKQIAGRAGRYKTAPVNTTASEDLSAAKGETSADVNLVAESNITTPSDSLANKRYQPIPHPSPYERALTLLHPNHDPSSPPAPPPNDPTNIGLVTTLQNIDYPIISKALRREPPVIKSAGLFFPVSVVDRFAQYFPPGTPFSYVLLRLSELAQLHTRFHLCGLRDALLLADLIEPVRNLSITDRVIFTATPAGTSDQDLWAELIPSLARCVEQQSGGALYEIAEIPLELLEEEVVMTRTYLRDLEKLHKALVVYLWLSYRFAGVFGTRALALEVKRRVEERIEKVLGGLSGEGGRACCC
ncbi:P-loop containing nucleoside triphosphate hydrolase protein [Elsinoe ampelina]|uniref:RNA helicase n=1 Tax=Elsinoe ampelina TaxID=302913 RepID=A0A6A6GQR2_9PEZI|nr:P-loop containing nucleoside triphosphate hydrolase protein [Elsinoe ampelina]